MKLLYSFAVTSMLTVTAIFAENPADNIGTPYGIATGVTRSWGEHKVIEPISDRVREANATFTRSDFDWNLGETSPGQWDFSTWDQTVKVLKGKGITLLPILGYDVPWAKPAWEHVDAWRNYVRTVVSRYQGELPYWEVWNEQNGLGKDDAGTVKLYNPLLKSAYEEIKKIDPKLQVLYGGTSHVPLKFIEASLADGAGNYFDVMNIHPYHVNGVPEDMLPEIAGLKTLMARYGVSDKPIWITEIGWPTIEPPRFYRSAFQAAFEKIGIDYAHSTAAVINDPEIGFYETAMFDVDQNLAMFQKIKRIRLADLKRLDVAKYPVLLPSCTEEFPMAYLPDVLNYVKKGGTIILPSGLPFYHDLQLDGKGGQNKVQVGDRYMKDFHIGWETSWSKPGVPDSVSRQKVADAFQGKFSLDRDYSANRFLHADNLKPGDQMIPIMEAVTDNGYHAPVFALYQLNSDLKGNVIVCTSMNSTAAVSMKLQAEMLPRTYLLALSQGIERIYWYNMQSVEDNPDEPEHHFGIAHRDLSKKPAFMAYQTLTKMLPANSTRPKLTITPNGVYLANWIRPDGVRVWALWTARHSQPVKLKISGKLEAVVDHLGEPVAVPENVKYAAAALLYLVGPETVELN